MTNLAVLGQNGTNIHTEIHRKNLAPRVQPVKVTQGHRKPHQSISSSDFLLVVIESMGLYCTASEINRKFFLLLFNAPLKVSHWDFVTAAG